MATTLPAPSSPEVLYVLDLAGYVFRAYHGGRPLSNSKGESTGATYVFAVMLQRIVREQQPVYLAIAMDTPSDKGLKRHDLYPDYKANRPEPPEDLSQQMVRCRELAEAYAIPILQQNGYEADDLIAACVREARAKGLRTVIGSADKDLMQLVAEDVTLWDEMRDRVYGPAEVKEKWGVGPERIADLLALMGDTSDNVPGVQGVGEKTGAKLLTDYGSLEGVFENLDKLKGKLKENLTKDKEKAFLSYKLVRLDGEVDVTLDLDALRYGGADTAKLLALYTELEFTKMIAAIEREVREKSGAPAPEKAAKKGPAAPVSKSYETVLTEAQLDEAIEACRAASLFAVDTETTSTEATRADLVGISLAWKDHHGVYIPVGHRVLGDPPQLDRAMVLKKLAPLLGDPAVGKTGHNIKYDDIVLRRAGAPVLGFEFDSMISSYLLDPERSSHKLEEVARAEFNYGMLSYEEVTKRGKKQVLFDEVEIATATRYSAEDADLTRMLTVRLKPRVEEAGLNELLKEVELPLALVLGHMEETGVLVDTALLKKLSNEAGVELARLEKELHTLAGREFNVNAPRQLEGILFDELKLPVHKRTKTSRSTDAEVLEELMELHALPGKVLEHRQLAKLQGTYLDALPQLVNPKTGRIHTSYNQAVAATGRLSSNNPNLQNIPVRTEFGRRIREAFVAPPGHLLLSADYSQIELRVLAHLSKDPILVDAFAKGDDIHTRTAVELFKVPPAEVTREMRNRAKTTNFAVIYGQGEAALARQLGLPRAEAAEFIKRYFETFGGLTRYLEQLVEKARNGEGVRTELGRRRFLPTINSENRGLRAQAERMAKNTPIQGTAADIMKVAMVRMARALQEQKLASKMILTVHDELVFEVPEAEKAQLEGLAREVMGGAMKLQVPLLVETGWGKHWAAAH